MNAKAMKAFEWRPLRAIDQIRLHEARLQAHFAAQWLARAARGFIHPRHDDSHTSMRWESATDRFETYPLNNGTWLSLRITNLMLTLHDADGMSRAEPMSLNQRSNKEIRQLLGEQINARKLDPSCLDGRSTYEMPAHPIARGAEYDASASSDALVELAAWFSNAEHLLSQIQKKLTARHLAASQVRCWPHHFDIASLTKLSRYKAGHAVYIGNGLSPGDEYYDEPYFYISAYPKPDTAALPTLPMIGHWHTHEFVAAVLPAHRVLAAKHQEADTAEFLHGAAESVLKIMS
jgi:hypothetical protein